MATSLMEQIDTLTDSEQLADWRANGYRERLRDGEPVPYQAT